MPRNGLRLVRKGNNHRNHDPAYDPISQPHAARGGPPKELEPPSRLSRVQDTWFYEGLAIVFSAACHIAIIGVLVTYAGRPAPSFSYGFTLNAIVSVLATASKASLVFVMGECIGQLKWIWFYEKKNQLDDMQLFDSASRGPLGSALMLWELKGRSLVSMGALITLLALTFDPFMQQILTYPAISMVEATEVTPAAAKKATAVRFFSASDDSATLGEYLQSIAYTAQWSENLDVNPTCPSGNCTWPAFQSLGVCSQCEDISDSTTLECPPFEFDTNMGYTDEPGTNECQIIPQRGKPANITMQISARSISDGEWRLSVPYHKVWAPWGLTQAWHSDRVGPNNVFAGLQDPLLVLAHAELSLVNQTAGLAPMLDLRKAFKLRVTQCALALCARTYNVAVSNGAVSFDLSDPEYGQIFCLYYPTGEVIPGPECLRNRAALPADAMERVDWSPCWKPGTEPPKDFTQMSATIWTNSGQLSFGPLSDWDLITPFLVGQASTSFEVSNSSEWSLLGPESWPARPDPNIAKTMRAGLEEATKATAAALTRSALSASNTTVEGTIYRTKVCVSVNWLWILLPTALIIFGTVFGALTAGASRHEGLSVWKSSILAVLFHGLDGFERDDQVDRYASISRMGQAAERVEVKLTASDGTRYLMLNQS